MPLQSSGPIKISEIMAELGIAPGTPVKISNNSSPGGVPQPGSLFGDASGIINKAAPHKISEFYGYANSVSFAMSLTEYGLAVTACGDTDLGGTKYLSTAGPYPEVSDTVYNEAQLTSAFDGNNKWFHIPAEDTVVQINDSGVVTTKEDCNQTLSASLSQSTIDETAQDVDLDITSNTSWSISSIAGWVSFSSTTGSGNATITVSATEHTGSGDRMATINVSYGLGTESPELTQLDIPYETINLGYNVSSGVTACGATPTKFKSDTTSLSTATILLNFLTENAANAGWYSDGVLRKYWNGSGFTSAEFC